MQACSASRRQHEGTGGGVPRGSITWGAELVAMNGLGSTHRESLRWTSVLQRLLPNSTVMNRALPDSGVSIPSFCLKSSGMMPDADTVDAHVVEFSFNDAKGHGLNASASSASGPSMTPLAGVERLIRRALEVPTPPLIIVLHQIRAQVWRTSGIKSKRAPSPPQRISELSGHLSAPIGEFARLLVGFGTWHAFS